VSYHRSRHVLFEPLVVLAVAAVVALWWIPAQTSVEATARMQPAVLPLVCAGAIAVLAAIMLIAGLRKPNQDIAHQASVGQHGARHWRSLCVNTFIIALGLAALSWWGLLAVPVVIIPPMMWYLGERRVRRIIWTVVLIAAPIGWLGA